MSLSVSQKEGEWVLLSGRGESAQRTSCVCVCCVWFLPCLEDPLPSHEFSKIVGEIVV